MMDHRKMQLPKIEVKDQKLSQLINGMETGKLQVPRFQRDFVWEISRTRALLDSIYKEFPIGTFFLWRAPDGVPALSRPLEELNIPAPRRGADVEYILDGQQRLTSLYVVIHGLQLTKGDYSKICLDLETATRYDQLAEDDFEEDIFVTRAPDNVRYVSVRDLLGPNLLPIFATIRSEWQPAFNKAVNLLTQTYPFSVVWVQEQSLANAVVIFQRINQEGKTLTRYDLICANLWTEEFDFRKQVEVLNKTYADKGFGKLDETIITQAFALILKDKCTTDAELALTTAEVAGAWDRVVRALGLAVDFAVTSLGVKRVDFLPYRGILVVLAYYFHHARSALTARERMALWQWFWRITLSERYSSTSPSKMAEDAQELKRLLDGQQPVFPYKSRATPEAVLRTKMTSTKSALRNAVLCLLALRMPKSFKDGSPVNLGDQFFSNLKNPERHHIFPVGFLKVRKIPAAQVQLLPNFCFIPADLNREISSQAPSKYLVAYQQGNPRFDAAILSHLIPAGAAGAVWRDDYDSFLLERAQLISDELNQFVDAAPGDEVSVGAGPTPVDMLEVRFRDIIDHRLCAVMGGSYWKRAVPGDVINYVAGRMAEWEDHHPYDDGVEVAATGRRRLDFCDLSHYAKIILRNWDHFAEFFSRRDDFERHFEAFRHLRNAEKHNREPSDIERKNGEAGILWFNRIFDRYDREASTPVPENGVEEAA